MGFRASWGRKERVTVHVDDVVVQLYGTSKSGTKFKTWWSRRTKRLGLSSVRVIETVVGD